MSSRRALIATLTVSVVALMACSTGYERRDENGAYTSGAAAARVDGPASGPAGARIQTGNLPSG